MYKIISGNKFTNLLIDLNFVCQDRVVSREEGLQFARRHSMLFIEASAKSKEGVQCAFEELVQKVIQTPGLWESDTRQGFSLQRGEDAPAESWCSC